MKQRKDYFWFCSCSFLIPHPEYLIAFLIDLHPDSLSPQSVSILRAKKKKHLSAKTAFFSPPPSVRFDMKGNSASHWSLTSHLREKAPNTRARRVTNDGRAVASCRAQKGKLSPHGTKEKVLLVCRIGSYIPLRGEQCLAACLTIKRLPFCTWFSHHCSILAYSFCCVLVIHKIMSLLSQSWAAVMLCSVAQGSVAYSPLSLNFKTRPPPPPAPQRYSGIFMCRLWTFRLGQVYRSWKRVGGDQCCCCFVLFLRCGGTEVVQNNLKIQTHPHAALEKWCRDQRRNFDTIIIIGKIAFQCKCMTYSSQICIDVLIYWLSHKEKSYKG